MQLFLSSKEKNYNSINLNTLRSVRKLNINLELIDTNIFFERQYFFERYSNIY